jgi:CRP-like cAMP-binding protein
MIREGDTTTDAFVLLSGSVKVTAQAEGHREALLGIRIGGDIVGELAARDGRPRIATVTVCREVETLPVSAAQLRQARAEYPDVAAALENTLRCRLRAATCHRVILSGCSVRVRLLKILAELSGSYGRDTADGRLIEVRFTQAELAAATGAAETSVHKALRGLREAGIVRHGYGRIIILRPAELDSLATGD